MDGTFDAAPPLFKYIFTIRVPFGNTHITVVYSLLQKKTRQTYEELFQAVIDKCNNLGIAVNITKVVVDFEDGWSVHYASSSVSLAGAVVCLLKRILQAIPCKNSGTVFLPDTRS
jgi:hypothetical protein